MSKERPVIETRYIARLRTSFRPPYGTVAEVLPIRIFARSAKRIMVERSEGTGFRAQLEPVELVETYATELGAARRLVVLQTRALEDFRRRAAAAEELVAELEKKGGAT